MTMTNPAHAGIFVKEEILDERGISITAAAEILKVARPNLNNVLNGHRALSCELAIKIEKAFGFNADVLMRMMMNHEMAQVRMNQAAITADIQPYKAA